MRIEHPAHAIEISLRFKPEAEAVLLAELDLLVSIWSETLREMQLAESSGQPIEDANLE